MDSSKQAQDIALKEFRRGTGYIQRLTKRSRRNPFKVDKHIEYRKAQRYS